MSSLTASPRFWQERRELALEMTDTLKKKSSLFCELFGADGISKEDTLFLIGGLKVETGFEFFGKPTADAVSLPVGAYSPLPLIISGAVWAVKHGVRLTVDAPSTNQLLLSGVCEILTYLTYPGFIEPGRDASLPKLGVLPDHRAFLFPEAIGQETSDRITRFSGRAGNSLKEIVTPKGSLDRTVFELIRVGGRYISPSEERILRNAGPSRKASDLIPCRREDHFLIAGQNTALSFPTVTVTEGSAPNKKVKSTQSELFSLILQ